MAKSASILPIVRHHILCENCWADEHRPHRVNIDGLITYLRSIQDPPYPLLLKELCVLLVITEGRGQGMGKIVCVFEETGEVTFETRERQVRFGPDPLEVRGIAFHIRDCRFPYSGRYFVEFWYDGQKVSQQPLLMR